eukprot:2260235-Rhodomonas_salina.1
MHMRARHVAQNARNALDPLPVAALSCPRPAPTLTPDAITLVSHLSARTLHLLARAVACAACWRSCSFVPFAASLHVLYIACALHRTGRIVGCAVGCICGIVACAASLRVRHFAEVAS